LTKSRYWSGTQSKTTPRFASPYRRVTTFTKGERPPDARESRQYFGALFGLSGEDMEIYKLVTEVFQLAKPISALHEEPLRSRVEAWVRK
jgi:hypothetical protein